MPASDYSVISPQTLTIGNRIVHGGSYPKGYQIINTSLKATVWVSANPGMSPGQGTSINPGTSLIWNRDGDLFLILGNDVKSTDAGSAVVTISYDVVNWQPDPVSIASSALNRQQALGNYAGNTTTILTALNKSLNTPGVPIGAFAIIDASLFSVLNLTIQWDFTAAASIFVSFYNSLAEATNSLASAVVWTQTFVNWGTPLGSAGIGAVHRVAIPVRAPYIRIGGINGNMLNLVISLNSSTLTDERTNLPSFDNITSNAALFRNSGTVIGAGAGIGGLAEYPYEGRVEIYAEMAYAAAVAAGALAGAINVFINNTQTVQNRIANGVIVGDALSAVFGVVRLRISFMAPSEQLLITLFNHNGAATTDYTITGFGVADLLGV